MAKLPTIGIERRVNLEMLTDTKLSFNINGKW